MFQDEKNQLLTTCMWFNLVWTDYQLAWNTSEYGGVDSVVIQPRNLWIPDILLYNRFSIEMLSYAYLLCGGKLSLLVKTKI